MIGPPSAIKNDQRARRWGDAKDAALQQLREASKMIEDALQGLLGLQEAHGEFVQKPCDKGSLEITQNFSNKKLKEALDDACVLPGHGISILWAIEVLIKCKDVFEGIKSVPCADIRKDVEREYGEKKMTKYLECLYSYGSGWNVRGRCLTGASHLSGHVGRAVYRLAYMQGVLKFMIESVPNSVVHNDTQYPDDLLCADAFDGMRFKESMKFFFERTGVEFGEYLPSEYYKYPRLQEACRQIVHNKLNDKRIVSVSMIRELSWVYADRWKLSVPLQFPDGAAPPSPGSSPVKPSTGSLLKVSLVPKTMQLAQPVRARSSVKGLTFTSRTDAPPAGMAYVVCPKCLQILSKTAIQKGRHRLPVCENEPRMIDVHQQWPSAYDGGNQLWFKKHLDRLRQHWQTARHGNLERGGVAPVALRHKQKTRGLSRSPEDKKKWREINKIEQASANNSSLK